MQIGSACGYTGSGFFPSDEEGIANAEFIVRACNAHELLIEALKDCARHPRQAQRNNIVRKALAAAGVA